MATRRCSLSCGGRIRRTFIAAVAWIVAGCPVCLHAQADDAIDTAVFTGRGVAFDDITIYGNIAALGDVDGDGLDDIGIAAVRKLLIVYGRVGDFSRHRIIEDTPRTLWASWDTSKFRPGVVPTGDLDGDGRADFAVIHKDAIGGLDQPDGDHRGGVSVIRGSAALESGLSLVEFTERFGMRHFISSSDRHRRISHYSGPVGDVNGDGRGDFAVSFSTKLEPGGPATEVFVVYDSVDLEKVVDLGDPSSQVSGFRVDFGGGSWALARLSGAGDINGDGFDDFVLRGERQVIYLVYGRAREGEVLRIVNLLGEDLTGLGVTTFERPSRGFFLQSSGGVGDLNGDGFGDLVLGASRSGLILPGEPLEYSRANIYYGAAQMPTEVYLRVARRREHGHPVAGERQTGVVRQRDRRDRRRQRRWDRRSRHRCALRGAFRQAPGGRSDGRLQRA